MNGGERKKEKLNTNIGKTNVKEKETETESERKTKTVTIPGFGEKEAKTMRRRGCYGREKNNRKKSETTSTIKNDCN